MTEETEVGSRKAEVGKHKPGVGWLNLDLK